MTKEQLMTVLEHYEKTLRLVKSQRADYNLRGPAHSEALGHAVFMCNEIKGLIGIDKMDKAHRWLGFLQGVLWTQGIFTIEEMRHHNR